MADTPLPDLSRDVDTVRAILACPDLTPAHLADALARLEGIAAALAVPREALPSPRAVVDRICDDLAARPQSIGFVTAFRALVEQAITERDDALTAAPQPADWPTYVCPHPDCDFAMVPHVDPARHPPTHMHLVDGRELPVRMLAAYPKVAASPPASAPAGETCACGAPMLPCGPGVWRCAVTCASPIAPPPPDSPPAAPPGTFPRAPADAVERDAVMVARSFNASCRAIDSEGEWSCTRAPNHTGDHVAGDGKNALARWSPPAGKGR